MSYIYLSTLGDVQTEILKGLEFYKEDIRIMETRLLEVASGHKQLEARQAIEHFENQFLIQRHNIGQLRHRVSEYARVAQESPDASESKELLTKRELLEEEYEAIERSVNELSQEFKRFLARCC